MKDQKLLLPKRTKHFLAYAKHATKDLTKLGPRIYSKMSLARLVILFVEDSNKTAAVVNYYLSTAERNVLPACSNT